ncbi:MAG: hypothetical protein ABFD97_04385 [Syntrophobacter sp.]
MERIVLRSGLSGFVLLDEISDAGPDSVKGSRRFESAPPWLGIEALAQLGAYHVRFLCGFEKHAFLLGVKRCVLPRARDLSGSWRLSGTLKNRSSSAYSYDLTATGPDEATLGGEFLFATTEYDDGVPREDILRAHYEKVFSCLRSGSRKNY